VIDARFKREAAGGDGTADAVDIDLLYALLFERERMNSSVTKNTVSAPSRAHSEKETVHEHFSA
jgi:hypothetical protein